MLRGLVGAMLLLLLSACESLGFYAQAVSGQFSILLLRQDVDVVLTRLAEAERPEDQRLGERLAYTQELLAFASDQLGLEVGGRYSSFVQLDAAYPLWNVFAAPELSVSPHTWCYPLVGCAPYRGYFRRARAEGYAARLRRRGLEIHVGGVPAYSTLGWFSDPLLSSFVYWPDAELAELLFHELAHGKVWVRSDVAFNEAFATFVGRQGAAQLLGSTPMAPVREGGEHRMTQLLLILRDRLQGVYESPRSDEEKRRAKSALLGEARACYAENPQYFGAPRFDGVMQRLNNAYLASLVTYEDHVPAFAKLFETHGGDWAHFFAAVQEIAELEPARRRSRLAALGQQRVAGQSDDARADQIECETLPGHGVDAESSRTEDDDIRRGGHG